jgi:SAM-dependent methyltransferase
MLKKYIKLLIPENARINIRYFMFKIRALIYSGNNYTCNCCGKNFRKFLTYGNIPRQNAACPYCNSLERNRVLWFYLQDEIGIESARIKLLHFAPERILKENIKKLKNIDYTNADINPILADEVVDIMNINYPDNTFDLILCSHVLGHVPDEKKGVDEMYRVLKKDGIALILTVIDNNTENTFENEVIISEKERLLHYGEKDLLRKHGQDFKKRLGLSKFKIEEIDYAKKLGHEIHSKYSLGNGERELIFKCIK